MATPKRNAVGSRAISKFVASPNNDGPVTPDLGRAVESGGMN